MTRLTQGSVRLGQGAIREPHVHYRDTSFGRPENRFIGEPANPLPFRPLIGGWTDPLGEVGGLQVSSDAAMAKLNSLKRAPTDDRPQLVDLGMPVFTDHAPRPDREGPDTGPDPVKERVRLGEGCGTPPGSSIRATWRESSIGMRPRP